MTAQRPGLAEPNTTADPREGAALANLWSEAWVWALVAGALFLLADSLVAPQHLPWKPLRIADPIGAATWAKVARIEGDPLACRAILAEGGVRTRDLPERTEGEFCEIRNVVSIQGGVTPLRPAAPAVTCPVALSFAIWERQSLQPAAREILGAEVTAIEHYGSYACRRIYGRESGRVSEHASANALDIAGFRLSDGRRVTVVADWTDEGPKGDFLRVIRDGACGAFETVLGPDYNAAHRDHLHFDRGPYRICR